MEISVGERKKERMSSYEMSGGSESDRAHDSMRVRVCVCVMILLI